MSLVTEIDRILRHSPLARAQPFIRAHAPWLHGALLTARDFFLPVRTTTGLTRYQHRAVERFLASSPDLSSWVLEIGSDLRGAVVRDLKTRGVQHVVGTNVAVDAASHRDRASGLQHYEILQADVRRLPLADASISAIISITAFEHILDFSAALDEMYRVLKPGGLVYSDFGPIWSSSIGHHVYAVVDGVEARHFKPGANPVPHYAQLLMTPDEVRSAVMRHPWVFPRLADAIVAWIFETGDLNRLFYEDYVRLFHESPFTVRHLAPVREHVPRAIQARLRAAHPSYNDFSVRMAEVVLEKRP